MANPTSNTVLITGINGFTGKHLEGYLVEKGFKVYGLTFAKSEKENHLECDILNLDKLKESISKVNPDYVIHLAAISFVASLDIKKMYETNIVGTINVLEALVLLGISPKKIIVASSAAVYGNIGEVLSEEMCPKPVNHYGNSKLAMEHMLANYFNKLEIIITRPFNYTGVGQEEHFVVPKIVKHYKEKEGTLALGNLNTFREYNDVSFLVQCYAKLLATDFKSGVVNIASGVTYSIKNILEIMKDISSYNIETRIDDRFVRKNEIIELKGSASKLIGMIGNLDWKSGLRETLEEMYFN